jgi:hypothetical protein
VGYSHWTKKHNNKTVKGRVPKKGYDSAATAKAEMERMYQGSPWNWAYYKCAECPAWHIGRKSPYPYAPLEVVKALRYSGR